MPDAGKKRREGRDHQTGAVAGTFHVPRLRLRGTLALLLVLMTFSAIEPASAQPAADAGGEPLVVPEVRVYEFQPKGLDTALRLHVFVPEMEPPAGGFPTLYAFDADIAFVALANMARNVAMSAQRAKLTPPVVIGIGYAEPEHHLQRRIYDLTPHIDADKLPKRPNGKPWPRTGGGDRFLDVLIGEIKPFIAAHYPVDASAETLAGHSLGGLLTLHTLLTRPDAFDRYVASSPSLWFGERETSDRLIAFQKDSAPASGAKIPLRLTVGSLEETLTGWRAQEGAALARRKAWLENNRMVGNARDLAEALQKLDGRIGVRFEIYSGLDHAAANFPAFYQALEFAVDPSPFNTDRE